MQYMRAANITLRSIVQGVSRFTRDRSAVAVFSGLAKEFGVPVSDIVDIAETRVEYTSALPALAVTKVSDTRVRVVARFVTDVRYLARALDALAVGMPDSARGERRDAAINIKDKSSHGSDVTRGLSLSAGVTRESIRASAVDDMDLDDFFDIIDDIGDRPAPDAPVKRGARDASWASPEPDPGPDDGAPIDASASSAPASGTQSQPASGTQSSPSAGQADDVLHRLKRLDPMVFAQPPSKQFAPSSVKCQKGKQPVGLSDAELEAAMKDKGAADRIMRPIRFSSGPDVAPINYVCPEKWCVSSGVARLRGEPCPDPSEPSWKLDNGFRFPGFLPGVQHPKGLCMPCCYKKPPLEGSVMAEREKQCLGNSAGKEVDPRPTEEAAPPGRPLVAAHVNRADRILERGAFGGVPPEYGLKTPGYDLVDSVDQADQRDRRAPMLVRVGIGRRVGIADALGFVADAIRPGIVQGGAGAKAGNAGAKAGNAGAKQGDKPSPVDARPGNAGAKPGDKPGNAGAKPGDKPGNAGTKPGAKPGPVDARAGDKPGNAGAKPGPVDARAGDKAGDAGAKPGNAGAKQGDKLGPVDGRAGDKAGDAGAKPGNAGGLARLCADIADNITPDTFLQTRAPRLFMDGADDGNEAAPAGNFGTIVSSAGGKQARRRDALLARSFERYRAALRAASEGSLKDLRSVTNTVLGAINAGALDWFPGVLVVAVNDNGAAFVDHVPERATRAGEDAVVIISRNGVCEPLGFLNGKGTVTMRLPGRGKWLEPTREAIRRSLPEEPPGSVRVVGYSLLASGYMRPTDPPRFLPFPTPVPIDAAIKHVYIDGASPASPLAGAVPASASEAEAAAARTGAVEFYPPANLWKTVARQSLEDDVKDGAIFTGIQATGDVASDPRDSILSPVKRRLATRDALISAFLDAIRDSGGESVLHGSSPSQSAPASDKEVVSELITKYWERVRKAVPGASRSDAEYAIVGMLRPVPGTEFPSVELAADETLVSA
jgi:hypothetical protein